MIIFVKMKKGKRQGSTLSPQTEIAFKQLAEYFAGLEIKTRQTQINKTTTIVCEVKILCSDFELFKFCILFAFNLHIIYNVFRNTIVNDLV